MNQNSKNEEERKKNHHNKKMIEDLALIVGLIGIQIVYAINSVLMSYLMSIGISNLSLVIFYAFATFVVLAPLAYYFERSKWPNKITLKLAIQLVVISFSGVTLFQSLFLKGIELTSPAIATAMPNLAPGLIFLIAWAFRLEKVELSCTYSKVKIVGTIFCVIGALMMSLLQSSRAQNGDLPNASAFQTLLIHKDKIIGCIYLLSAVIILSSNVVLQATTLGDFPAPISMCAVTSLIGVFTTIAVELIQERKLETGYPLVSARDLLGYSLLGGTVSGVCVSFNGWAMKKRGPVLVSMFSPIATVLSLVISVITLDDTISYGSLAGMCLIFTGLYFVLWAKGKEDLLSNCGLESKFDLEKPLLS